MGYLMDPGAWQDWQKLETWPYWMFDVLFYNVRRVPPELWNSCTFRKTPEDSIIILKRTRDRSAIFGRRFELSCYKEIKDIPNTDMDAVRTVALAGVGSSGLGAVALAIDVADAVADRTSDDVQIVAAIVTGDGSRNVLAEALEGWYVLGEANINRQRLLGLSDIIKIWLDRSFGIPAKVCDQLDSFSKMAMEMDLNLPESTLVSEFIQNAKNLKLVIGHSKGCLYLNNALCKIADDARDDPGKQAGLVQIAKRLTIVTLGAVIFAPSEFDDSIHQFIGEYDALGAMNSRPRMKHTVIPGVMHHLNTAIPMHMDCNKVLNSERLAP